MILTDYIDVQCMLPEMKSKNKAEALKELTHLLFDKHRLRGMEAALDQVMAREGTESTGIGHGIALPHARVSGLRNLYCAIGRFKNGLDFSSVDKQPVHLVFLICYPPTQQTTYLNFVAVIAKLLRDKSHFQQMVKAETPSDIFSVLSDLSKPMEAPEKYYAGKMKADPDLLDARDARADIILLARLQLCQEMYETARTGKRQIKERMKNIRDLVDPRILRHYDRLMAARPPALVPVEADTCQGCFMRLPSQFAQKVREGSSHIHTCSNCSRFIYVV